MGPEPSELTERQAYLVLNAMPGVGSVSMRRLLGALGGDPRAVLAAPAARLAAVEGIRNAAVREIPAWLPTFDLHREEERMAKSGVAFVVATDGDYPAYLREIHDPPLGLYRKGTGSGNRPCIAIVGSRAATLYGQSVAKRLARELAALGFCIVSGLARGIDTAAHEGALEAGGFTVAVLGTGIDVVYPPENLDLYRRIAASGAILSELPFGRAANKQTFPMRNRVISGMSVAIIVVETDVSGGSMITARLAGEQGRLLFAVPGRIDQSTSAGCNQLIRDGATLLTGVADLISELSYLGSALPEPAAVPLPSALPAKRARARPPSAKSDSRSDSKSDLARPVTVAGAPGADLAAANMGRVLACFRGGAIARLDELAHASGLTAAEVGAALTALELEGRIERRPGGAYEAV